MSHHTTNVTSTSARLARLQSSMHPTPLRTESSPALVTEPSRHPLLIAIHSPFPRWPTRQIQPSQLEVLHSLLACREPLAVPSVDMRARRLPHSHASCTSLTISHRAAQKGQNWGRDRRRQELCRGGRIPLHSGRWNGSHRPRIPRAPG